ncbi:hypothetical protein EDB86DRAFT_2833080 [Lactarius hatsudake]|nr:hypothetical protein EDB86DRAFT_2833080 [Lactarius hatsudake]
MGAQPQHHAENSNTSGTPNHTHEDPHMHLYMDEQQYPLQDIAEDYLPQCSSQATQQAIELSISLTTPMEYNPLHSSDSALPGGIRAAHTVSAIQKGHALQTCSCSASLASVLEVLDSYDSAGQLPTPHETPQPEGLSTNLEISDRLFDSLDMYLESNDNDASRVQTADSRNPLFTVVDRCGVFDMEIVLCACSGMDHIGEQFLRAGLFLSTFKQIETLFTFSVLEDFITDNLE